MSTLITTLTYEKCQRWISNLRSGKFNQTQGRLKKANQHWTGFCCLGVLRETEKWPKYFDSAKLVRSKSLSFWRQSKLIEMNDDDGCSFNEIADYIEQHILPKCTKESELYRSNHYD